MRNEAPNGNARKADIVVRRGIIERTSLSGVRLVGEGS